MIAQFKHRAYKQAISDRLSGTSSEARIPDGGRTERIFNRTMFVVMGKLAKLDGLVVVTSGAEASAMADAAAGLRRFVVVASPEAAAEPLRGWLTAGDCLLLKASRGVALERLLPALETLAL